MKKVKERNSNKAVMITVAVCLSVILVVVLLLTLVDPIYGRTKIKKARETAAVCSEIVISAPMYDDPFLQGAEVVISGEEAQALAEVFLYATDKISYDESFESIGGFWNTKLEFYSSDDRCSVYLNDDEIYVTKDTKGYKFEIDDDCEDAYEAFWRRTNEILDDSKK